MKSIYTRITPEAMASSVNSTMKGKKAVATTQARKPATAAKPPAAGFKPISGEPSTWDIDMRQTTRAMIQENRAIMKDGSKVSWR